MFTQWAFHKIFALNFTFNLSSALPILPSNAFAIVLSVQFRNIWNRYSCTAISPIPLFSVLPFSVTD